MIALDPIEFFVSPVFLIIILLFARTHQRKKIEENPAYKYYTTALLLKLLGGIAYGLIYEFYYKGAGDTFAGG